ncbi:hypothetical protein CMUST_05180 [Corynebacterium mustelae]|uniref:Uncharacterized protein n=1 Tax=Corynebacterium mustelae TaxID=571915 RepID=A0A0G3GW39_9CORY|nr:hypothetical protein [Corynebacterium mustelae]AKK05374.1 hypothetical protein CMUST_05180 [Corynebacterium mustelae]
MDSQDKILEQLRSINPVPSIELSEEDIRVKQSTLNQILATDTTPSRRFATTNQWLSMAAAVAVFAGGAAFVLNLTPVTQQGREDSVVFAEPDSAHGLPDAVDDFKGVHYLTREDADSLGKVTTTVRADGNGQVVVDEIQSSGSLKGALKTYHENPVPNMVVPEITEPSELAALAAEIQPESPTKGALHLMLTPGVTKQQRQVLYEFLIQQEGNTVQKQPKDTETGKVVSVTRESEKLSFDILADSGQVIRVQGLMGEGITTTVLKAGSFDCVAVDATNPPAEIDLSCGDGNYRLDSIRWDSWGKENVTGSAIAHVNDCTPSCADGTIQETDVSIAAREIHSCGLNMKTYSILDISYPKPWRYAPQHETFSVECLEEY